NMTQTAVLSTSDGASIGEAVAIAGNTVIVGAEADTTGDVIGPGAAYVFTEPASGWTNMTQTAELTASDGTIGEGLGSSISISGNTVVVGADEAAIGGNSDEG